jgi:hypothetical protein
MSRRTTLLQRIKHALQRAASAIAASGSWRQLTAVRGNRPDHVTRIHSILRSHGVRCTYQVVGTGGGTPAGGIGAVSQTIKLLVHRDDFHKAKQIVDEYERG